MVHVRKSGAVYHHARAARDGIVRHKMLATITHIHRDDVTLIFVRRASFRSYKWHSRTHQEDERQNMCHSCQSEKTHGSPWPRIVVKERDCRERSRIHFVTIISPLRPWFILTFQCKNIAILDQIMTCCEAEYAKFANGFVRKTPSPFSSNERRGNVQNLAHADDDRELGTAKPCPSHHFVAQPV